jgi:phosphoribosyl-ATP pyrophosphohydrolase/phosphoribosyl-AMP cyclohydrolase
MIIPSIDIMNGRAVQLRRGREFVLDGGDPLKRLEEFSVAGEVAIVDLDAALGKGSNANLIRDMIRRAPCRVGGGIRDLQTALDWLDNGATQIVIGTKASVDFCSQLPRERVVAAVDAEQRTVVVDGWRTKTKFQVIDRISELASVVGGFLLTQVEYEGEMAGFSIELVEQAIEAADGVRLTAAGGITTAEDVAVLDNLGVDSQVGMALYSGHLTLGSAVAGLLANGVQDRLWPTVVCDESGTVLGLVWSTRESLEIAISQRKGIYWSRSRQEIWVKGATSGATQELVRVDLDCDRDALRFTVRQHGPGFCHTEEQGCWPTSFTLSTLGKIIEQRQHEVFDKASINSGTNRVLADPELLKAKLLEEAEELSEATDTDSVVHEASDLIYFTLVAAARYGVSMEQIRRELECRNLKIRRRPMAAKTEGGSQ